MAAATPPSAVPAGTLYISYLPASSAAGAGVRADGEDKVQGGAGAGLVVGSPLPVVPAGEMLAAAAASGVECTALSSDAASSCFGGAFAAAMNTLRAASSRPPVAYNRRVSALATAWSRTVRELGTLQHSDLSQQLGPAGTYVSGQNLALAPASVADPVAASMGAWAAQPGNRGLLLGGATHVGVGVVKDDDGRWWVSLFFATCFESDPSACPADEAPAGGGGGSGGGRGGGSGGGDVSFDPDFEQPWLAMCKVSMCTRGGGERACWFVGETTFADFASRIWVRRPVLRGGRPTGACVWEQRRHVRYRVPG